ncbi:MAG TPA: DUF4351 domain-containing protein [Pirellulales bacterium]|nr:DUF4351 domain-containing protein [Pirellulales bacterium]
MDDHDQRFKTLLQLFFADFLRLFFSSWAERFDFKHIEWLNLEVFADPPKGRRRTLDLVAKLQARKSVRTPPAGTRQQWLALVHVEIEGRDRVAPLRPRMWKAYHYLRDKYDLPVLPIGVYLRVGLDGIGTDVYEEHFWEFRPVRFEYLYVGLPALDGLQYVTGDNWLGVALSALMRVPEERQVWLGAQALRRITEAPLTEQQRYLLGECVQAYLPFDESQWDEFNELLNTKPYEGVKKMRATWFDQGVAKGREEGRRESLRELLEQRFGPLSKPIRQRLQSLPTERLETLFKQGLRAKSLGDLGLEGDR